MRRVGRDERPHRQVAGVTRNHMSRPTSRTRHIDPSDVSSLMSSLQHSKQSMMGSLHHSDQPNDRIAETQE